MGCSSSNQSLGEIKPHTDERQKSANTSDDNATKETNYPPSEAYVISFNTYTNSTDNESILTTSNWNATKQETIRPPERLQKVLEEHKNSNANENISTIESITEKLEKAELRRQTILQNKIEKAQKLTKTLDETTILENEQPSDERF